jgi:hypothetical protein
MITKTVRNEFGNEITREIETCVPDADNAPYTENILEPMA